MKQTLKDDQRWGKREEERERECISEQQSVYGWISEAIRNHGKLL